MRFMPISCQRMQMRFERDTIHLARCIARAELHAGALGLPYANDDEARLALPSDEENAFYYLILQITLC